MGAARLPRQVLKTPSRALRPGHLFGGVLLAAVTVAAALTSLPARAEVVIGLAAPLSGRYAAIGQAMHSAAAAAAAEANERGGLRGEVIKLVPADDGCSSPGGSVAARQLADAGARIVVGHWCASAAVSAAPIYAQANIVLLALTRHALLTDRRAGPGIFRLAGRDDQQGHEAARYVANAHKLLPVALIHDRTGYARGLAEGFLSVLTGLGLPPVLTEGIVASEKDYSAVAGRIKASGARLIYFAGFPAEAAILLSQIRSQGTPALMLGSDSLAVSDFAERAGQDADGTIVMVSAAADAPSAADRFSRAAIEIAVDTLSMHPASAAERAAHLGDATFQTSVGPISFDAKGDASIASFAIYRWTGGKLQPAE